MGNNIIGWLILNQFSRSYCVISRFECRKSAESPFLVTNKKSLKKHPPYVWNTFGIRVKRRTMYFSANFINWHFNCNILGKMIVLRNWCINLLLGKCYLGQIATDSQEMCSDLLKCFPVNSSNRFFGSWNPNFSQCKCILGIILL